MDWLGSMENLPLYFTLQRGKARIEHSDMLEGNEKQDLLPHVSALSPSPFIILLELLAISIRNNHRIKGITMAWIEIKLVIFAYDMTTFVRDKQSYLTLFNVINLLLLLLGNRKENASSLELDVREFNRYVKILGVYFSYNTPLF